MSSEFKDIYKVTSVYVATTIGAAFASGQEILQFFTRFLKAGFAGILLSGILFALVGYMVLDTVYRFNIGDFSYLMSRVLGPFFGKVMEAVAGLFSLCVYILMIAGAGSIIRWFFNFPNGIGIVVTTIICMVIMLGDIRGITIASEIMTPVIIVGMIIMGIYISFKEISVFNNIYDIQRYMDNWLVYSVLYVCYNSILSVIIMCNMLPWLSNSKVGKLSGIFGGIFLCFVSILLNYAMFIYYHDIFSRELPMLELALRHGRWAGFLYTVILCFAMLTTATSSGFCFAERFESWIPVERKVIIIGLCMITVPLSRMGFPKIISVIYPIFGCAGFIMLSSIIISYLRGIVPKQSATHKKPHF